MKQKTYKKLEHKQLSQLPSVFQIVELYCGYAIYKCKCVYYAFRMDGVWVDVANNFVLGFTRSTIDALRSFIDSLTAFQELSLKLHLLTVARDIDEMALHLDGCKMYNIRSDKEYCIQSPVVKKNIAEDVGLLVSELNKVIEGEIVAGWILVR